jgi:hypothetical protein
MTFRAIDGDSKGGARRALDCSLPSPLRQIQLAEQHRIGISQPRHDGGVDIWNEVLAHRRAAHRADTFRVTKVFHRDGHTVERPAISARMDFLLGCASRCQRLISHHSGVAFQAAIDRRDSVQHPLRQIDR